MARKPASAVRMSLYRLTNVVELRASIRDKYLEEGEFVATQALVNGREALVVTGSIITESASWAPTLKELTGLPVDLGNKTAAAVLIIRRGDNGAWAVTYGMGFQLLNQSSVDGGFGQRIAIRTADPSELNSLTRTTLDERSRADRFSIPSGDHLRNFGVGDFGELITRLEGYQKPSSISFRGPRSNYY